MPSVRSESELSKASKMMMTLSRSCLPESPGHKMPLKQRFTAENEEDADYSDKGISGIEEIPNISKFLSIKTHFFLVCRALVKSATHLIRIEPTFNRSIEESLELLPTNYRKT